MKKTIKTSKGRDVKKQTWLFRSGVFVMALLAAGMITGIARYGSHTNDSKAVEKQTPAASSPQTNFVTREIGGRKLQVNAKTLQQGPLTQDQAQQIAAALKDNQSSDGLVQVQNPDGSVSVDLEGRFQNVILAKKNNDGSVEQACVDNAEAAKAFLQNGDATKTTGPGSGRRAVVKE
jgi:hypothetical protein